jgi:beta-glucanase (GH16 family)
VNRVRAGIAGAATIVALVGGTVVVRSMDDGSELRAQSTGATTSTTALRTEMAPAAPPAQPSSTPPPAPPTTTAPPAPAATESTAAAANDWQLVASDEFDGDTVDTGTWTLYEGAGNGGVGLRSPSANSQTDGATCRAA